MLLADLGTWFLGVMSGICEVRCRPVVSEKLPIGKSRASRHCQMLSSKLLWVVPSDILDMHQQTTRPLMCKKCLDLQAGNPRPPFEEF